MPGFQFVVTGIGCIRRWGFETESVYGYTVLQVGGKRRFWATKTEPLFDREVMVVVADSVPLCLCVRSGRDGGEAGDWGSDSGNVSSDYFSTALNSEMARFDRPVRESKQTRP